MKGKILAIAGSDPSGGAGIQADLKTISALGGYGMAAITALTVQNTQKVYSVHPVSGNIVSAQVMAVLQDIMPDAIKVGMMGSASAVESLAQIFGDYNTIPLIVDPVILSSSGYLLLDQKGIDRMILDIFPNISLLTPNLIEAAFLTGMDDIVTIDDMKRAGERLRVMGPRAVLIKGGHLSGDVLVDILMTGDGVYEYSSPKIKTNNTHGTGCSLASAIATGMGQGMALYDAVHRAHRYIHKAIENAPGFGQGKGPLNHLVGLD